MSLDDGEDPNRVIYLDCHSTTPVDPAVLQAMLPCFSHLFGNPGSQSHWFGSQARELVETARSSFAATLGVEADEIVFTSGATESNNLAIFGSAKRWSGKRNHLVTIGIEHPSVIEPMRQLEREGWRVSVVPVFPHTPTHGGGEALGRESGIQAAIRFPGVVDLSALRSVLSEDTALVSIAVANHEIGVVQPIREIANLVHSVGAWLHTDATQAVGWLPLELNEWQADLVSFSGHKFYGPKGVGALFVRRRPTTTAVRPVRLLPRAIGGGQEFGMRSGTLNTPGIVGIATALRLAEEGRAKCVAEIGELRQRFWARLGESVPDLQLNGPDWSSGGPRLPHNLNFSVPGVEGQTIMLRARGVAVSSGSACSSSTPGVSTVLKGIGLSDDHARSSLRIGLARFHDSTDIELAAQRLSEGIRWARG